MLGSLGVYIYSRYVDPPHNNSLPGKPEPGSKEVLGDEATKKGATARSYSLTRSTEYFSFNYLRLVGRLTLTCLGW